MIHPSGPNLLRHGAKAVSLCQIHIQSRGMATLIVPGVRSMGLQLRRIRLSNHDIQLNVRSTRIALQPDLRDVRSRQEATALVVLQVLLITAL